MDVLTAIETRSSAPRLGEPAPDAEQLQRILSAGAHAPDHGRLAPWRFVIIAKDRRQVLGEAMAQLLKRNNPDANETRLDAERKKALRAPMIIAVAARPNKEHKVPEVEQLLAAGAAVQNMFLAANALGFGAMWKTGGAAYDKEVKTAIGLEPNDHIVAYLYLGTASDKIPARPISLEGAVSRL